MTPEELNKIIAQGEGVSVEFKRCGNLPEADTFETICSFANRQGGNVFLGVSDKGALTGIDPDRALEVERNIANHLHDTKLFNAAPSVEFDRIETDEGLILRVWVPVGPVVYRFKGTVYDRVADADVKIVTDFQLSEMYIRKQEYYSERKVYRYLEIGDLRLDLLPRVREMALARRANHPWGEMDDETLLRSANLYLKDYETGIEGYTLAAALLLGKDDVISSIAPAYKTDAYVQRSNKDRYDDRVVVTTNLIEAYDALLGFAQKHLPDKFFLEETQSISLRDVISRELIANTLMHREYTSPFPAKFVIDDKNIATENASRPRFIGTLSPERFNPLPKNPIIADFFGHIGRAESLGSGTRNLFKYSWAYGGGQPVLTEGDVFRADVPIAAVSGSLRKLDVDWVIQKMLESYGYVTVSSVSSIAGVTDRTVRRHIADLVSRGVLTSQGESKLRRFVASAE